MSTERKPLTARSVVLSVLLGTDPPRLPVHLLVRTAGLFGIADGTTRTALSRMAAAGEVAADDGWYAIASPRLLMRRQRQEQSRHPSERPWDGHWHHAVVVAARRPAHERAALRSVLAGAGFAELREGVWMRPSNLDRPAASEAGGLAWFVSDPEIDPRDLAGALWDLPAWASTTTDLLTELDDHTPALAAGDRSRLADGFVLSAAVLRHLRADPLLPAALVPDDWPGAVLRQEYDRFDAAYRAVLRSWFDEHR
ncbi:MAG: PaaX family transcriptional regulator C-terminal domain-containing protein [Acidimicrobiales bacterium]